MTLSPHTLDALVRQIAAGEITADAAARRVLDLERSSGTPPKPRFPGGFAAPDTQNAACGARSAAPEGRNAAPQGLTAESREPLERLVMRLGPPPPEIEADWQQQLQAIARRFEAEHGRPIPPLSVADLLVDTNNRLTLRHECASDLSDHAAAPAAATPVTSRLATGAGDSPAARGCRARRRNKLSPRLVAACAAFGLLLVAGAFYLAYRRHADESLAAGSASVRQDAAEPAFTPAADSSTVRPAAAENEPPRGQPKRDLGLNNPLLTGTFVDEDFDASDESDSSDDVRASSKPAENSPEPPPSADNLADVPDSETAMLPPSEIASGDAASESDIDDQLPVDPLPARPRVSTEAISLDPPLASGPQRPQRLFDSAVTDIRWQFPIDTTLELHRRGDAWALIDTADESRGELATLRNAEAGLDWVWADDTAALPLSRQVPAGRLQVTASEGNRGSLWLRPHLQADPYHFDFHLSQVSASWPLEGPPIFSEGRLEVELPAPESLELTWVDEFDPSNLRRNVSTAQWTHAGSDSPAIRCRLDLRVTTRLTLRARFLAQLDPSLPWQPFSSANLASALDQMTLLLNRALLEQTAFSQRYSAAATSLKQRLRPQKEALDAQVTRLQFVMQRLQQLDSLQAAIAAAPGMRLKLTAAWPDAVQPILELGSEQ